MVKLRRSCDDRPAEIQFFAMESLKILIFAFMGVSAFAEDAEVVKLRTDEVVYEATVSGKKSSFTFRREDSTQKSMWSRLEGSRGNRARQEPICQRSMESLCRDLLKSMLG